jgi:hypothetical protein
MSNQISVEVTKGLAQDITLRQRYEKEGFGLETAFERQDWAEKRVAELKRIYGLADSDVRLIKHISSPETGEKTAWEVYVRDNKGVEVLFL